MIGPLWVIPVGKVFRADDGDQAVFAPTPQEAVEKLVRVLHEQKREKAECA